MDYVTKIVELDKDINAIKSQISDLEKLTLDDKGKQGLQSHIKALADKELVMYNELKGFADKEMLRLVNLSPAYTVDQKTRFTKIVKDFNVVNIIS